MSEATQEAKRAGARIFGVLFQIMAVLTLFCTFYAAFIVTNLGSQFGIAGSKDPATWIILASGLFASCVLAGIGYTLGILCAIYDRQALVETLGTSVRESAPSPRSKWGASSNDRPVTMTTKSIKATEPVSSRAASPSTERDNKAPGPKVSRKNPLWEWLTRERHFRQSDTE
jgi:hypothetical protein